MSTNERKALGRGFSALLQSVEQTKVDENSNFIEINLEDIALNPPAAIPLGSSGD